MDECIEKCNDSIITVNFLIKTSATNWCLFKTYNMLGTHTTTFKGTQGTFGTQIWAARVFFLLLFSCNFDDKLSKNFHRFVILYMLGWNAPSENSGKYQIMSSAFNWHLSSGPLLKRTLLFFMIRWTKRARQYLNVWQDVILGKAFSQLLKVSSAFKLRDWTAQSGSGNCHEL